MGLGKPTADYDCAYNDIERLDGTPLLMIIRATTATGDMTFGNGLQNYFTNEAAIEANIRSKLLEWVGDSFWNLPAGIDYLNLLSTGQQQNLVIAIKTLV